MPLPDEPQFEKPPTQVPAEGLPGLNEAAEPSVDQTPVETQVPDREPTVLRSAKREQRRSNEVGRQRRVPSVRRVGRVAVTALAVTGALTLIATAANMLDLDLNPFPEGTTEVEGTMGAPEVEVTAMSGIVTAEISAKQSIDITRKLNHVWPVPDCSNKIDESKIPMSGLVVIENANFSVASDGQTANVEVTNITKPTLAMPIEEVLPNQPGDGSSICLLKDGKDRMDSPDNVVEGYARELLGASSKRIGECVLNKANDPGSDVNQLLTKSIAESVAHMRGIDPSKVTVTINTVDTEDGLAEIKAAKDRIVKAEKDTSEIEIDTVKVESCKLQKPKVVLTDQPAVPAS